MSANTEIRITVSPSGKLECTSNRPLPETVGVLEMAKASLLQGAMSPAAPVSSSPDPASSATVARVPAFSPRGVA